MVAKAQRRRFTAEDKRRIVRRGGPLHAPGRDRGAAAARGPVLLAPDELAGGAGSGRARDQPSLVEHRSGVGDAKLGRFDS